MTEKIEGHTRCEVQTAEVARVAEAIRLRSCERGYPVHPNVAHHLAAAALDAMPASAQALMDLNNPDVLMNVVNAKINDYVEMHNRGDLTEHGEHGWLVLTNLRRDMEFAIKRRSPEASSAQREGGK